MYIHVHCIHVTLTTLYNIHKLVEVKLEPCVSLGSSKIRTKTKRLCVPVVLYMYVSLPLG